MESARDLVEKYMQDYKMDQQTKQKAEELYIEYYTIKNSQSPVRFLQLLKGENLSLFNWSLHFEARQNNLRFA